MSSTVRVILLISAIAAILISILVWLFTKAKVNKIRSQYRKEESKKYDKDFKKNAVEERGDTIGELLWDLKDKTINPLDDISLEYIINTCIRNGYKTFNTLPADDYIKQSLTKLAKANYSKVSKELVVIKSTNDLNETFDKEYKNLDKGGMIFIVEAPKRGEVKKLLSYTRLSGIRREFHKYGKGMVIVAK